MDREDVQSTCIASIGYSLTGLQAIDAPIETTGLGSLLSGTLEIEFTDHSVYRYSGVPGTAYAALFSAPSIGAWFNYNIRNNYTYVRVG